MNRHVCRTRRPRTDAGFTIIEVLIAMTVTMIVMAAVFGLLVKGQDSFRREPEVADLNQNIRAGLDTIARDLATGGYKTPSAAAIAWHDGGGIQPDELTIIYANPEVPTSQAMCLGGAGCRYINRSSVVNVDPTTIDPGVPDMTKAYSSGMLLMAIETGDCNNDGAVGITPFEVTGNPVKTSAGGVDTLQIRHNPGLANLGLNFPGGFNGDVDPRCAVIGQFRVVRYRINPLPPDPNPTLERSDLAAGGEWIPVAVNIENLQVQYGVGASPNFVDAPAPPVAENPNTWIMRVKVTLAGRTESRNLQGSSQGVFAADDTHLRKTLSTTVSLRNIMAEASNTTAGTNYN